MQEEIKRLTLKVVEENEMPCFEIRYKNEVKRFSAVEITANTLGKMKKIAESYMKAKVRDAVVTVPSYFNDSQRQATIDAGKIAGLNISRLLNETAAVVIAYSLNSDPTIAKKILVFRLGGGTFDVSIFSTDKGKEFMVLATAGNSNLGGRDFDNCMVEEITRIHKLNISDNEVAMRRLRTACEQAKWRLSTETEAIIEIDSLCGEIDFCAVIKRNQFEEMCADLFALTIKIVDNALKDANLKYEDIDEVLLVGGSIQIPRIKQLLRDRFKDKEIVELFNTSEAVAHGAAVEAAVRHGSASTEMKTVKLLEVTPFTLGVAVLGDFSSPISMRNTQIPVSRSEIYHTVVSGKTSARIQVSQGESHFIKDNFEIGVFEIDGIPAAPAGVEEVDVTFSIDESGMLTAIATSKSNHNARNQITIENVTRKLK